MNNYVILKWQSLKAYNFTEDFYNKNKKLVEELNDIWNILYENTSGAISSGKTLKNDEKLKIRFINVLEKLFDLGVIFQNGWSDEYYNTFEDIKSYLLN